MRDPQISGANGGGKRRRYTLVPDYMFEKFDDIGVDFLKNIGVRSLVIDIDNTLAPYEVAEPDEDRPLVRGARCGGDTRGARVQQWARAGRALQQPSRAACVLRLPQAVPQIAHKGDGGYRSRERHDHVSRRSDIHRCRCGAAHGHPCGCRAAYKG